MKDRSDRLRFFLDRASVLVIGVAVGSIIGLSFGGAGAIGGRVSSVSPVTSQSVKRATDVADCAAPFSPRLLNEIAAGKKITIGVFGDSFGDGVWASLYWSFPRGANFNVIKFSQESTGFTRYQSLDLEQRLSQQLTDQPVDIAVIDFGANDTQGIVADGHAYALQSPQWKALYAARRARFVTLLRSQGAMVYWIGLPKMRDRAYDNEIAQMNSFHEVGMRAIGVPFIDVVPLSVDDAGQFNMHLRDPRTNETRLMRANDGIHMSMAGYQRLAAPLVDRIKRYLTRAAAFAGNGSDQPGAGSTVLASLGGGG